METTGFNFFSLDEKIIFRILNSLFDNKKADLEKYNYHFANIGSFYLLNMSMKVDPRKILLFDLIHTRLWIRLISTMGIIEGEDKYELKWCQEVKDYHKRIIKEQRYTRRVHDLLDILKLDSSIRYRELAKSFLNNLILTDVQIDMENLIEKQEMSNEKANEWYKLMYDNGIIPSGIRRRVPDNFESERQFLLGEMSDIPVLDDDTILDAIKEVKINRNFQSIKYWDVRKVTIMSRLFEEEFIIFDKKLIDLSYWDTSNVINMSYMFYNNYSKITGITNWNTSNVEDMSYMFNMANYFNQPLNWDTRNVINMTYMFRGATSFNQPLDWDTSNVEDMSYMFRGATSFNQPLKLDTSNVENMEAMFRGATSFNQPLDWNTSNVKDMSYMFSYAPIFNQPLNWNTSNVINMSYMFYDATSFTQPLDWDTSNVEYNERIFERSRGFFQKTE